MADSPSLNLGLDPNQMCVGDPVTSFLHFGQVLWLSEKYNDFLNLRYSLLKWPDCMIGGLISSVLNFQAGAMQNAVHRVEMGHFSESFRPMFTFNLSESLFSSHVNPG